MIEIDGATGESGGQIIRTAMTLSAITKKPVHIFNIRAGRPNPGLQAQHLTAVKAVRNICRGTLTHAEVGSTELTFEPGEIIGGKYEFNIGTAGAVTLVAQTVLPILLFAKKASEVTIIGGTHVIKSPGYDYFEKVFLKAINKMNVIAKSQIKKIGFYPKGGGEIVLEVEPSTPTAITNWTHEDKNHVEVIIRLAGLDKSIAVREKKIFVQNDIEHVHIYENDSLS
ncbi:MAG: RNA 3'-terminal phosphate cyclase, partial [Candidatus Micrarchaeota archaeon]|nr:RNA 3'-terminal phosphate cyclase [Candidatus Micrarchaeota archaeon]